LSLARKEFLTGINEGQIAMDMSTVLPAMSLREQEAYAKRGVDFLDAPVFGSKKGIRGCQALDYGRGQEGHFLKK